MYSRKNAFIKNKLKIEKLSEDLIEISNQNENLNDTVEELSEDLIEISNQNKNLNDRVEELSEDLIEISNQNENLNDKIKELSSIISDLSIVVNSFVKESNYVTKFVSKEKSLSFKNHIKYLYLIFDILDNDSGKYNKKIILPFSLSTLNIENLQTENIEYIQFPTSLVKLKITNSTFTTKNHRNVLRGDKTYSNINIIPNLKELCLQYVNIRYIDIIYIAEDNINGGIEITGEKHTNILEKEVIDFTKFPKLKKLCLIGINCIDKNLQFSQLKNLEELWIDDINLFSNYKLPYNLKKLYIVGCDFDYSLEAGNKDNKDIKNYRISYKFDEPVFFDMIPRMEYYIDITKICSILPIYREFHFHRLSEQCIMIDVIIPLTLKNIIKEEINITEF
jgi:uncharacterized protein YoxC